MNFAFVGRVAHYHTSADDLENLDPRSVQHHGEHLLGLTRDLASGPPLREAGDAVYFDVFAAFVVGWPEGASVPLALLTLVLVVAPAFLLSQRKRGRHLVDKERLRVGEVLWGGLAVTLGVVVGVLFVLGLGWLIRGATPTPFVASPGPLVALFWGSALASVIVVGLLLPRCTFWGTATAVWLVWGLGGFALASTLPGVSYLLVVPALVYGAVATLLVRMGKEGCPGCAALVAVLPLLAAACLYVPMVHLLVDSMGIGQQAPTAWVMVVFLSTATPLFARRELLVPPAALLALCLVVAVSLLLSLTGSPYTAASPRRLNLCLEVDASAGTARWLLLTPGELPASARGQGFSARRQPIHGLRGTAFVASATAVSAAAPRLDDLRQEPMPGGRVVRFVLRSSRGASEAGLLLPRSAVLGVRMQGHTPPFVRRRGDQAVVWCNALPPSGLQIELRLKGNEPVQATVLDTTPGLPAEGQQLLETLRDDAAVSSYKGDQLIMTRRVRF